ncbi:hypothetical protein D3X11_06730 [Streptococcus sp. X16XC17]|nr:hypothetical protein D3X11_06730 [Streptococcus sp. X16XC17]
MKKYSTLLLSSAVLLASLAQQPVAFAQSSSDSFSAESSAIFPETEKANASFDIQSIDVATWSTQVESAMRIRVKESNYAGKQYVGDFRGWFNPVADGVTTYIYPN